MVRVSSPRARGLLKWICYIFIATIIVEVVVFNALVLVAFMSVRREVTAILNSDGTLLERLMKSNKFQEVIYDGRSGGFVKLIQETVGRLYIVSPNKSRSGVQISGIGLDVSNSGEALYLYKRIQSRANFPYENLIVDIGANDGFVSSNSFNFLEWGWSAILVEPQSDENILIKLNNRAHVDPYNEGRQSLQIYQGILSEKDGFADFVLSPSVDRMESHKLQSYEKELMMNKNVMLTKVPSLTVRSFVRQFKVPKKFGILSIDAEGVGDSVLHQWMDLDFRPAYIIYEGLHNSEPIQITREFLEKHDYRYLNKRGWNYIFEHSPVLDELQ